MWTYIIKNIRSNASIYEIKELPSPNGDPYYESKGKDINDFQKDLFIVTQDREFLIDEKLKIYALTRIYTEDQDNKEITKEKTVHFNNINLQLTFNFDGPKSKERHYKA
jgi:hypothetical protein